MTHLKAIHLLLLSCTLALTSCTFDRAKTATRHGSKAIQALFSNTTESRSIDYNTTFPKADKTKVCFEKINSNTKTSTYTQIHQSSLAPENLALYTTSDEPMYKSIYFSPKEHAVSESKYRKQIQSIANELNNNPYLFILVEGHTDNNGTQTYNMSLGNERAQSVKKILLSCGVNKNQIKTVSYGKEFAEDSEQLALKLHRKCNFKIYSARNW